MSNVRFKINGSQIGEPEDWQSMKTTLDFTKDKLEPTLSLDRLNLVGAAATLVTDLLAVNGYYQGIPFVVEAGDSQNPVMSIDGYLDPSDNPLVKASNEIEISLKKRQSHDWLVAKADSFSYRELADKNYNGLGKIVNSDLTAVPYIINYIPEWPVLIPLFISSFLVGKELVDSVRAVVTKTTDLIQAVVPSLGGNAGGPVAGFNIAKIITNAIGLAVQIAFTVGVMLALIKLIELILEQIAPLKRYHLGMGLKDLVVKGCERLGLTVESDLLDSLDNGQKWVTIPQKGHKGGQPPTGQDVGDWIESGVPGASSSLDTFGGVIRFLETTFNAEYKIKDDVFRIERKDYWRGLASYVIPDTLVNQETLQDDHTFNTDELNSNVKIKWETDLKDLNTLDNSNGQVYQAVTFVKSVQDEDLVNLTGLKTINIPMSLAIRKDKLTVVEEVLKAFLTAADFLSGQLGQPQSFATQFNARIGSMHLSDHFTSRAKMVVMEGSGLANDQRSIMAASKLWQNYHYIDSFVTIDGENAQQVIYKEQLIPFCDADYLTLQENQYVTTKSGEPAKVERIEWTNYENSALITYRVFRVYDENLDIKYLSI